MAIKRTFFITLMIFLFVWGFAMIDRISSVPEPKKLSTGFGEFSSFSQERRLVCDAGSGTSFLAGSQTVALQIEEIDRQISELEAMKKGYEARAMRHEDQAQRLQFEDRAVLETRRHNELAAENRIKADRIEQQIQRLREERKKLMLAE